MIKIFGDDMSHINRDAMKIAGHESLVFPNPTVILTLDSNVTVSVGHPAYVPDININMPNGDRIRVFLAYDKKTKSHYLRMQRN